MLPQTIKRWYACQGTKYGCRLVDRQLADQWSTALFVPPSVFIKKFACPCLQTHAEEACPSLFHDKRESRLLCRPSRRRFSYASRPSSALLSLCALPHPEPPVLFLCFGIGKSLRRLG